MFIFPTIRHSGSHFVVGLFGFDINKGKSWKHNGEGDFYFDHIHPSLKHRFLPLLEDNTVVIPLRHPKVVAKSWQARKKDELEMIEAWRCLVNDVDAFNPHYLPVDADNRDEHLKKLNADLGLDLETDWQPKGVKQNNSHLRHHDITATPAVDALCKQIQPFLNRFY